MIKRPIQHFAHYTDEGAIIGLYNDSRHMDIPVPYIPITAQQRDALGLCPSRFYVDTITRMLCERAEVANTQEVDITDTLQQIRFDYEGTIAAGVMVNSMCFYADAEASDHVALCLAIYNANADYRPQLLAVIGGEACFTEVDGVTLLAVAEAIAELRVRAKAHMLVDMKTAHDLIKSAPIA